MSELRPHHADPAAPLGRAGTPGFARTPAHAQFYPPAPAHVLAAGTAALAGARDALRARPISRETLRAQIVRYAAVAREQGASGAELAEALDLALAPALAGLAAATADELRVHIGWWAAHGYHRAD